MRSLAILLAALSVCSARPQTAVHVRHVRSVGTHIIDGENASPGEFPWQLSMTRGGSHSCGASLLSSSRALCAAHCVDGAVTGTLGVIAGLHNRNDLSGTQSVGLNRYVVHENYQDGLASYAHDISLLYFDGSISIGGNVQAASLPSSNGNSYDGYTCVLSGWGRTDASNNLPNTLQKTSIPVISTSECQNAMSGVGGANIWDNHICVQDPAGNTGACNGDSGGPLNCPDGGTRVVGVTSWVVASGGGACLPAYPSVYTRVGAYLSWINNN